MNVFDILNRANRYHTTQKAVIYSACTSKDFDGVGSIDYQHLYYFASIFSSQLNKLGVVKGDRIAVFLPNVVEYPIVTYGALRIGAVPVLISIAQKKEKVRDFVLASGAKILVTSESLAAEAQLAAEITHLIMVEENHPYTKVGKLRSSYPLVAADCEPHDPAFILYTSGTTTGEQKGAVLSHGNVVSNVYATNHHTGMTSQDVGVCFLPLFHCFGQNFVMNSIFNAGATMVLHRRFELMEVLESIRKNRVSIFYSIPPNYRMLHKLPDFEAEYLRPIRYFFTAADTMPVEVAQNWRQRFGKIIHEGWGLTETSPFATYNHDYHYRDGSVGTPIENVEVRIVGEDGVFCQAGDIGEIAVRGPNVFSGYYNDPEATASAIRHGWFYTGDIGYLDEDGYLFVVDRKNDRLKVHGFSVWPREIEKCLRAYFGARLNDIGVIGVPDEARGQMPYAFAVKGDAALSEEEIIQACKEKLGGYQLLKGVKFVDLIPKTPTGKILKHELRKLMDLPPDTAKEENK